VRSPFGADDGARFRRGRLVHRLLQSLPELPAERRRAAAVRFLARPVHGLEAAAAAAITDETLAVLEQPDFAALFGPGSRAEVPLVGLVGGRVVSGQVDRLLVTDDAVLVVDYKTNRPAPSLPADVPAVYLAQLAAYRAALAVIYPGKAVRCLLLWTDGPRLMELSADLLDAHAPAPPRREEGPAGRGAGGKRTGGNRTSVTSQ
jgi:ATP-dependent helicase/nuclease subunit A